MFRPDQRAATLHLNDRNIQIFLSRQLTAFLKKGWFWSQEQKHNSWINIILKMQYTTIKQRKPWYHVTSEKIFYP